MKHNYLLNDICSDKNIGLRTKNRLANGDAHYLILADPARNNIQLIIYQLFIIISCMLLLLFINVSTASAHTNLTQRTIAHLVNAQRVQGNPDANVTIVAYTDFQCYWCRKFEELDLPYLIKNYINTGKVYLIYRDFPLTLIHPFAFKAAKYADCSALQSTKHNNKYLKIRNLLYKYQSKWSTIGDIYYFLKKNDKGLLNMKKEQSCVKHNVTVSLIKQNIKKGTMLGVTGTPTLFIYKGLELVKTIRGYQPIGKLNKLLQKIAG
ncbi:MAG: DsbA family protein [Candidatus Acididesulfobacter guangdongensis]|uniref:DsbA family protein n=1 Tax=Acididesulfobacter guangdongensis TaxID=2597225 RepID=A0A519BHP4_ACIG2|nr:MAG: DsbA family protein [Candidatus Acididesulfobacter guangdongensis]